MKIQILIFYILFSTYGFSQVNKIRITDSETNETIPFANIFSLEQKKGFITNVNGELVLDSSLNNSDTLVISCIGYESEQFLINHIINFKIELSPKTQELNEVVVTTKKIKFGHTKIGITKKPKTMFFDHYLTGETGDLKAVWIPNKKSYKGQINSINIFITDLGYPNAYFRIHIYECNTISIKPGKELLTENIIANGNLGNKWININLENKHLKISENGFFVGIEWFSNASDTEFSDTINYDGPRYNKPYQKIFKGNGCVVGIIDEKYLYSKEKVWYKNTDNQWDLWLKTDESMLNTVQTLENGTTYTLTENNFYLRVPCINAEIKYVKEKNETEFDSPIKRKLNKIEKTKENKLLYPQNSIESLFSSLIKGVENDDLIYLLKYLCVYKGEEFDLILEELKSDKNYKIITPVEKKRIISELTEVKNTLKESNLKDLGNFNYELKVNGSKYYLINEKGLWKINPYSYKII